MYHFYSFGFVGIELSELKSFVESVICSSLSQKDSEYYNSTYSFSNKLNEKFVLQNNFDGEYYLYKKHTNCSLILDVTIFGEDKAGKLKEKLAHKTPILIKHREMRMKVPEFVSPSEEGVKID